MAGGRWHSFHPASLHCALTSNGLRHWYFCLGIMTGWRFAFDRLLASGSAYPLPPAYLHLAGALLALLLPLGLGLTLRRCSGHLFKRLDKAVQPCCLLVVLVSATVSIYGFMQQYPLITWRMLAASAVVTLAGSATGVMVTALFRLKVPQVKSVAMSMSLPNSLLASVLIHTTFTRQEASYMMVMVATLNFVSQTILFLYYVLHLVIWVTWTDYRIRHENVGISGASRSFAEKLVR